MQKRRLRPVSIGITRFVVDRRPPAFCFLTLGPLGFFTLQENMLAQKISFVLLVALTLQFLAYFVTSPDPHRVACCGP